jgi:uncharacterized protein (TIGR03790 family)
MILRIILLLPLFTFPLFSQTTENVLLVLNETSPVSMDAGAYYAQKRGIPESNILRIRTNAEDGISPENFQRQIHTPIASWLTRNFAQDRILYIVLTKGIPLRITGTSGINGTTASVDSELTLLYRRLSGQNVSTDGPAANPYFLDNNPIHEAKQFNHRDFDIYLVSRLDGYNIADIQNMIYRGTGPVKEGKIILDAKSSAEGKGDLWLKEAANALDTLGFKDRVLFDNTEKVLKGTRQVLGYYSWGSNDPAIRIRNFGMEFAPGALAGMFVSTDGRTFTEPPEEWQIGTWDDRSTHFAGSPQSLVGDLIREGVTGIAGHVAEPYLESTIRPNILFPAYLSGFNLIESFYLAMPNLSWMTVVVGDPLCAPFRTRSLSADETDPGIDPGTELPAFFGARKLRNVSLAAYKSGGVHPDTIKLILRSEARLVRQDRTGARQALEESIARDDRLAAPQLILASLYEAEEEYDKAIERYRRILELAPDTAAALNNLAYALAVRKNSIEEALPLAEKAYALSNKNPSMADTLGWIYHLSGKDDKAAEYLEKATRSGIQNAQIHLHFAVVSAVTGNTLAAEIALERALEIDPELEKSEEVKQLRENLK